jgi:hypothetical protein
MRMDETTRHDGRRFVAVAALFALLVCASLASAGQATGTPSVGAIVLRAAQVGPGYKAAVIPGGRQIAGQVTLDLCDYTFASESQRIARIQDGYVKPHSGLVIGNEVVAYQPGGTAAALSELRRAVKDCPATPRTGPTVGEQTPVTFHLTTMTERHLASPYVALRIGETATVNGRKQTDTDFAIYQFRGNVMTAVYGLGLPSPSALTLTVHAAQQAARNLG